MSAISTSVNTLVCTSIEDRDSNMRGHMLAKTEDIHNAGLATYKGEAEHNMVQYWLIRSKVAMIYGIAMRSKE